MKYGRVVASAIVALLVPCLTHGADAKSGVEVKGAAYAVVEPNIAHFFVKVRGSAETYEVSTAEAERKLRDMKTVVAEVFGSVPEIMTVRKELKPEGQFDADGMMEMQQKYIASFAQAMKGGELPAVSQQKREMLTEVVVYFPLTQFTEAQVLKLKSELASRRIAFDKGNLFDFAWDQSLRESSVLFGLQEPAELLAELSLKAHAAAAAKAEILARAAGKKRGEVTRVFGYGEDLEGSVRASDIDVQLGRSLGPVSTDPHRLVVKFSKEFVFDLK